MRVIAFSLDMEGNTSSVGVNRGKGDVEIPLALSFIEGVALGNNSLVEEISLLLVIGDG